MGAELVEGGALADRARAQRTASARLLAMPTVISVSSVSRSSWPSLAMTGVSPGPPPPGPAGPWPSWMTGFPFPGRRWS